MEFLVCSACDCCQSSVSDRPLRPQLSVSTSSITTKMYSGLRPSSLTSTSVIPRITAFFCSTEAMPLAISTFTYGNSQLPCFVPSIYDVRAISQAAKFKTEILPKERLAAAWWIGQQRFFRHAVLQVGEFLCAKFCGRNCGLLPH